MRAGYTILVPIIVVSAILIGAYGDGGTRFWCIIIISIGSIAMSVSVIRKKRDAECKELKLFFSIIKGLTQPLSFFKYTLQLRLATKMKPQKQSQQVSTRT